MNRIKWRKRSCVIVFLCADNSTVVGFAKDVSKQKKHEEYLINYIGIPENLQPFIFDKKTRAARPGLNGEVSNGIGLNIVKELTNKLGGTVSFESKENRGSRFTLEFPKG